MFFVQLLLFVRIMFPIQLNLQAFIEKLSAPLQSWCVASFTISTYRELNSALLCGKTPDGSWHDPFISTGLYHLLVVSGAHLIFLVQLIELVPVKNKASQFFKVFILLGFTFMAGAQPPLVRALLHLSLTYLNQQGRWQWRRLKTLTYSGLLTLFLIPSWVSSLSFWLSWLAAFAVSSAESFSSRPLKQQTVIYILLLPALLALSSYHPFSILANLAFAPFIGFVMLPSTFLALVFSPWHLANDWFWAVTLNFLKFFSAYLGSQQPLYQLSVGQLSGYVLSSTLARHFWWRWQGC